MFAIDAFGDSFTVAQQSRHFRNRYARHDKPGSCRMSENMGRAIYFAVFREPPERGFDRVHAVATKLDDVVTLR